MVLGSRCRMAEAARDRVFPVATKSSTMNTVSAAAPVKRQLASSTSRVLNSGSSLPLPVGR